MNSYLLAGAALIGAGKLQQCVGRIIGSRKQQILGFDRELRGRSAVALGAAQRASDMGLRPVRIRNRR
ncbi:MAG: hypothetical protein ABWY05_02570 [Noviherbaspirillum sp.]